MEIRRKLTLVNSWGKKKRGLARYPLRPLPFYVAIASYPHPVCSPSASARFLRLDCPSTGQSHDVAPACVISHSLQRGEPFSVMLRTWSLRECVGDGLTLHVLSEVSQLHGYAENRRSLLRGRDFGNAKVHHVLGRDTITVRGNEVAHLSREGFVGLAGLGNRRLARLGDGGVHLTQNLHDLGRVLAALNSESESIGAGNAIRLGSHKAAPICPIGAIFSRARVAREWHKCDLIQVLIFGWQGARRGSRAPPWQLILYSHALPFATVAAPSQANGRFLGVNGRSEWSILRRFAEC